MLTEKQEKYEHQYNNRVSIFKGCYTPLHSLKVFETIFANNDSQKLLNDTNKGKNKKAGRI